MKTEGTLVRVAVLSAALFALSPVASGQQPVREDAGGLQLNSPIVRKITTGESHEYRFALQQGQVLSVELEELNVNLVVEVVRASDSKSLLSSDFGGGFERETLTFLADKGGSYVLKVSEAESESGRAAY